MRLRPRVTTQRARQTSGRPVDFAGRHPGHQTQLEASSPHLCRAGGRPRSGTGKPGQGEPATDPTASPSVSRRPPKLCARHRHRPTAGARRFGCGTRERDNRRLTQEHEPRPRSPLPRDFGRTRLLTSGTLRPFRSFDRGSPLPGHKHGWAARQAHARPPGGPGVPLAGAGPPPGRWPGPSALTADRARASPAAGRAAEAGAEAEVAGSGTASPPPLPRSLAAENASQRAAPRPPGAAQKFRGRRRAGGRGRRPSRGRGRPAAGPRRRGLTSFWRGSCG